MQALFGEQQHSTGFGGPSFRGKICVKIKKHNFGVGFKEARRYTPPTLPLVRPCDTYNVTYTYIPQTVLALWGSGGIKG